VDIAADGNISVNVVEHDMTVTLGDTTVELAVGPILTGFNIPLNLNSVTIDLNKIVEVTGTALTPAIGDVIPESAYAVTGSSVTIAIGNEGTEADANVTVSGTALTPAIGDVDAVTVAEVTGSSLTSSIGSVVISANATVVVTGSSLTPSISSAQVIAWAEVDTGTDVSWTEVDLAA
jgi:hypothetical protein